MKLEKYLSEGRNDIINYADRQSLIKFADNITRFIAGDRKQALNNMRGIKFDLDFSFMEPGEYNIEYKKLYDSILKAFGV